MAYGPDWPSVRRRAATRPWAASVLAAVQEGFTAWAGVPIPGPERESAWIHHYFCDADGAELRSGQDHHVCTDCGKVYAGEPWDGAWRARTHDAVAGQAQRAALLHRLKGLGQARAELERILSTYARDYLSYRPHGEMVGVGRVQPQSLDEAVWAVGLLRAARWSGDALSPATSQAVDRMARAVADLLRPQVGAVHNIHCWLLAALAECAARLGDTELLTWCRDGEHGAEAQVRQGFHPEGLWYEVNAHYHYYALAALLSYAEAAGPGGLSEESEARLSRAIGAPPLLAYADGRLPAYGDGWPDCFVAEFAPQAEAAWTLLPAARPDPRPYYRHPHPTSLRLWYGARIPDPTPTRSPASSPTGSRASAPTGSATSSLVSAASSSPAALAGRNSVAALVFGPDDLPPPGTAVPASFAWPRAGIALLRSPAVRLAIRSGPDAGWHDHRDKLAVDAETVTGWSSLDLGTSGYGSEFTAWMRSPAAHNTVTVGARPQPAHTGRLVEWSAGHVTAESAWDGHVLRRTITVNDHGWTDVLTVTLAHPDAIEWAFHGDGAFVPGLGPGTPADLGHAWLRDVRRLTGRPLRGAWSITGSPHLTLTVPEGFTAYAATAPGNPNGRPLGLLLLRGHATEARFEAAFTIETHEPSSAVTTT
ncbi:heparinase II/III family protein [Nonomuraea sp. NPDC050643]|uniref:heparinase II/III domain-containing protein n=1 Tax=Nonomuraea sp. NPDC050643 TaxID=3155660 RepID=UPI0033C6B8E1